MLTPRGKFPTLQASPPHSGLNKPFSLLNQRNMPISASFLSFQVNIKSDSRQTSFRVLVNIKPPSLEHYPFAAKFSQSFPFDRESGKASPLVKKPLLLRGIARRWCADKLWGSAAVYPTEQGRGLVRG